MRALATTLLLTAAACGPAVEVTRYAVDIVAVERCVLRGGTEMCEEPAPIHRRVPVVVEIVDEATVTLYTVADETGTDRAFLGRRQGAQLALSREASRVDEQSGCTFKQRADLVLTADDSALEGTERIISDESEACSELGIATFEREERAWRGEREP